MKHIPHSIMAMLLCVVISGTLDMQAPHAATATPAAPPPAARRPAPPAPPPPEALMLVRSRLGALGQASESGDYAALRAIGGSAFRADNPATNLAATFAPLRGHDLDQVLVLDPVFTEAPHVRTDRSMTMAGYFLASAERIDFRLAWRPEQGRWRLAAIAVGLHPKA